MILFVVAATAGGFWAATPGQQERDQERTLRALAVAEAWHHPDAARVDARLEAASRPDELSDAAVRAEIRSRMAAFTPTEAELHEWYERNRDLFGERSFEQARSAIELLLRIERTREALRVRGIE